MSSAAVVPSANSSVPSGESRRAKRLALFAILDSLSSVTRISSWIWAGTRNDCMQTKVSNYTTPCTKTANKDSDRDPKNFTFL